MERGKDPARAASLLAAGGLVVIPTETSYGLAANALDSASLARLFAVKRRKPEEPVGIFVPDHAYVEEQFSVNDAERRIMERYWPGAVNILLAPRQESPITRQMAMLAPGRKKVSIRISSHPLVQGLCAAFPEPFTSTSANRSGAGDVYAPEGIERIFSHDEIAYLLDDGTLPTVPPSTVIEWDGTRIIVHRQGAVRVTLP